MLAQDGTPRFLCWKLQSSLRKCLIGILTYYNMFFYTTVYVFYPNMLMYVLLIRLELTERDYTPYFYNETEDGEEGTRMIRKTKKKKKNVVGVPNEDDWSNASCFSVSL